jgi:phage major head subunit gpT-like protein
MPQINANLMRTLGIAFNTAFQGGLSSVVASQHARVATPITSTTKENEYGWLGKMPRVREWVGDRVVHGIASSGYAIRNKSYELTIAVDRDDIDDDNIGIYTPMFTEMGAASGSHYDELVFGLLKAGFGSFCYDGQFFFDTDHPVLDANGTPTSVANTDGGAGTPWFLIDDTRALKPIILQKRKPWKLVRKDQETDDNVFEKKEYVYGVDARHNVGFGFWQTSWGSKQPLTKANYKAAREAMMGMRGDSDRPLGLKPRLLVVPPALEGQALEILNAERDAAGATNVYKGTAELLVCSFLA